MKLNLNEVKQPQEFSSVLSWTLGPHLLLPGSRVFDDIRYLLGLLEKLWELRNNLSMAPFWRVHVSQEISNDCLTCQGMGQPCHWRLLIHNYFFKTHISIPSPWCHFSTSVIFLADVATHLLPQAYTSYWKNHISHFILLKIIRHFKVEPNILFFLYL